MKRDLPAAIIISLVLHAVLLGALHLAVLPAGRDAAVANVATRATAGGGTAPIRVVMAERRPSDGPARADGAGRADDEVSRPAPDPADLPPDARAEGEASAVDAEGSGEPAAGREPSGESAGDSTADDLAPAGEQANELAAHNAASAENPSPPETRASRPPRLATPIEPEYPFRARRLGHEGTVAFTVLVGAGGAVLDITLDESSGHAQLDRAARAAVGQASYIPGSSDSPMSLRVRVVFRLEPENRGS